MGVGLHVIFTATLCFCWLHPNAFPTWSTNVCLPGETSSSPSLGSIRHGWVLMVVMCLCTHRSSPSLVFFAALLISSCSFGSWKIGFFGGEKKNPFWLSYAVYYLRIDDNIWHEASKARLCNIGNMRIARITISVNFKQVYYAWFVSTKGRWGRW